MSALAEVAIAVPSFFVGYVGWSLIELGRVTWPWSKL